MKVINRARDRIDVSFDAIKDRILRLCNDSFDGLDIDSVVIQTINGMYDGISTRELDELSAGICASMQSDDCGYDVVASRIYCSNMFKCTRDVLMGAGYGAVSFSNCVRYLRDHGVFYDDSFLAFVDEHAEALNGMIDQERNTRHSYFALKTLERSYLLRAKEGVIESPQDMWMRVSVAISIVKLRGGSVDAAGLLERIRTCYDDMSLGFYTHATPTLFNAGLKHNQCSSCYLMGTSDSMKNIFKTISDAAQISKWAGGIGVHVSNIRAKGSRINSTNGVSDGIVPMLRVYNDMVRYCNQAGRRKGSLAVYLEPWHADVWEFLELRRNTGAETDRARDIFLALWVPDEFMRRVDSDDDWYLMSPDACPGLPDVHGPQFDSLYAEYIARGLFVRKLKARELWRHILASQIETGTPYICYKDHVNAKTNQKNIGTIKSSNLCAEIMEFSDDESYAVCNLASIPVNAYASEETGAIDYARLHEVAKRITYNLNCVIDSNMYPVDEARMSNMFLRPIGIGVQGMGDLYCMLGLPYDSKEACDLDADVMETIYHGAMEASVELAELGAPYAGFRGSPASAGELQFDLWGHVPSSGRYDWGALRLRLKKYGCRNSLLTALMPTASTSQILGNSESFEPFQSNLYKRTTLAGEFMVVNRHLQKKLCSIGMWSPAVKKMILQHNGSVQNIDAIPDSVKAVFKTAWELPQRSIIDHAVARAPFVCQSQSMNLYMNVPSFDKLTKALFYGWRKGLKTGMYYLRSTAAVEAIQVSFDAGTSGSKVDDKADAVCSRSNPDCLMCSS